MDLFTMKKYVAHSYVLNVGDVTCFCRYGMTSCGILYVSYFMPKQGFSVIWKNTNRVILTGVTETCDGRYTKVQFVVHPSYYIGESFDNTHSVDGISSVYDAMDAIFNERLRYLNPEKHVRKEVNLLKPYK